MIVYNTTFHIESDSVESCLNYLKKEFIPVAVADGRLRHPSLMKILHEQEGEGESYAMQFHVDSIPTLNGWLREEGNAMHKLLINRFGTKIAGFSTLMEELSWE